MSDAVNTQTGEVLTEEEAAEYAKIDRVFKKFKPRFDELNKKIKRVYTSKGKRQVGDVIIDITTRNTKDVKAAEAKYPREKYPHLWKDEPKFQFDALTDRQKKPFQSVGLALSVDVLAEDSPKD
jgi:hypothetical protein